MTKAAQRTTFVLVLGAMAVATLAAQTPMRAGRWEVTAQMQMPNMQMPELKTTQCITPEQLKDPAGALPNAGAAVSDKCKVSDYKVTGNIVTWKMECTAPQTMSGSGELTFAGDTYTGTMKMTMQPTDITMKLTGKRVGDCTP